VSLARSRSLKLQRASRVSNDRIDRIGREFEPCLRQSNASLAPASRMSATSAKRANNWADLYGRRAAIMAFVVSPFRA
jgi:hypothetical protein